MSVCKTHVATSIGTRLKVRCGRPVHPGFDTCAECLPDTKITREQQSREKSQPPRHILRGRPAKRPAAMRRQMSKMLDSGWSVTEVHRYFRGNIGATAELAALVQARAQLRQAAKPAPPPPSPPPAAPLRRSALVFLPAPIEHDPYPVR